MAFLGLLGFLVLVLLTGVPIAYAIGGFAIIGNWWFDATSFTRIAETQFSSINSFVVMAIPFFIYAGNIMLKGAMARSLFDFTSAVVCWVRGGSAISATGACAMFGALTGSSAAASAALAPVIVPELTRLGYPRYFGCGLLASGGTLGIMIPPSVVFVVYGALTGTSVASLFIAGIIPGILLAIILAATAYIIASWKGFGESRKFILKEVWATFIKAIPSLFMPILVLGGIYGGWFTPTEAAAVSVAYAMFVTVYVYKTIKWRDIFKITIDSAKSSAIVMIILAASIGIGQLASFLGIASELTDWLKNFNLTSWQFLLIINVVLLFLGCFFDGFTLLVLLTPLLLPSLREFDINLIHFAIIFTANIEIASITPPVGFNLFVLSATTNVPLHEVIKGVIPFTFTLLFGLFLLTYIPYLSLVLVS